MQKTNGYGNLEPVFKIEGFQKIGPVLGNSQSILLKKGISLLTAVLF
jgi:hypothetical protein